MMPSSLPRYASLHCRTTQYPAAQFNEAWRTICLNQFHDIIPGSSIGPVYEESQQQYAELAKNVTQLRDEALQVLSQKLDGDIFLVNPTSFTSTRPGLHPRRFPWHRFTRDGEPVPVQQADTGFWVDAGELRTV